MSQVGSIQGSRIPQTGERLTCRHSFIYKKDASILRRYPLILGPLYIYIYIKYIYAHKQTDTPMHIHMYYNACTYPFISIYIHMYSSFQVGPGVAAMAQPGPQRGCGIQRLRPNSKLHFQSAGSRSRSHKVGTCELFGDCCLNWFLMLFVIVT